MTDGRSPGERNWSKRLPADEVEAHHADCVRTVVFEALDAAVANDYEITDAAAEAVDLSTYDADLEGIDVRLIEPHVRVWLARRAEERTT